jgi:hypothetical protein
MKPAALRVVCDKTRLYGGEGLNRTQNRLTKNSDRSELFPENLKSGPIRFICNDERQRLAVAYVPLRDHCKTAALPVLTCSIFAVPFAMDVAIFNRSQLIQRPGFAGRFFLVSQFE